nr:DUF4238 domain-containing protein [uncultured Roseateles sp.]
MGNHFVPQFYLRGFESAGRIWAHDRHANRSFSTQVKTIANENDLYPDELETRLNETIEKPARPALIALRERRPLSPAERLALALYVVTLWKRVPQAGRRVLDRLPEVVDEVHTNMRAELDLLAQVRPEMDVEGLRSKVAEVMQRQLTNPRPELWHSTIESESGPRVVDALLSMNWVFLYHDRLQFLTCDNPVFFESEGIGSPKSELTLPISNSLALWATRTPHRSGSYLQATPAAVKQINTRTAHNSTRFIYSQRNELWILPFTLKGEQQLQRLEP